MCHASAPIGSSLPNVKQGHTVSLVNKGGPMKFQRATITINDARLPTSLPHNEPLNQKQRISNAIMSAAPKPDDSSPLPSAVEPKGANDLESQCNRDCDGAKEPVSAFKALGWIDRFLAVWIFLAMAIGIILGNFVPETGPALQKGKFVGVSVPIGMYAALRRESRRRPSISPGAKCFLSNSYWPLGHDVPDPVQGPIRVTARAIGPSVHVEADTLQHLYQLGCGPFPHGNSTFHALLGCVAALTLLTVVRLSLASRGLSFPIKAAYVLV